MWKTPKTVEHLQIDGYTHYNFAILHGTGVVHAFNFMRYNHAFLARHSDLDLLLEVANGEHGNWINRRYAILLCRYDWIGKTKAHWERGMLESDQELEEHSDIPELYELNSDITILRVKSKLKWQHELEVTGSLSWVLQVLYENRAIPASELDANKLECAFYDRHVLPELTVTLRNYLAVKAEWKLPDQIPMDD